MQSILFALFAFLGWGSGDVFGGLVSRKIKGYSSTLWLYIFSFILSSLLLPLFWGELSNISPQMWALILFLNIMGPIPVVAFYEGIRVGNASLVGTIGSAFAALTVVLSVIFLGDTLSPIQTISVSVIFAGLILSSLELKSLNIKKIFSDKGVPYGLVSMILWGVYFTFIRIPVREVGWFWPSYSAFAGIPVILMYMRFKKIKLEKPLPLTTTLYSLLNTILLTGGTFSYNFAVMIGQTSIVAPIAGSYPILYIILSRLVFKDKFKKQQLAGILIVLLGIVILSFSNS
ncbi:MAG: DMT family transporter [Patescibacteria group bacterium]|jgi:drug/metabolite transporter (DMT)-like permease